MPDILSPEGFAQVKELFLACLDLPLEEQQQLLDDRCGGDEELKQQVWKMLHSQPSRIDALTDVVDPAACMLPDAALAAIGQSIGPYKLLEQLGEGGMGIVYVAEQQSPIRRHVALKLIKPGMDTRQVVARFEAERQALALMDHPHIARVFDGGSTDQGRPYFVMELVRGVTITEFCDCERMAIHERLELFIRVCWAVQHAHQKGIIHRDLKPTNILVTRHDTTPVPKVIDFGIAKAVNQTLTDKTIYTKFAQFIGTPLYMSPEQAELSGLDIDTRSDIYSLGVMLYELLTGTTPFDAELLRQKGLDELRRIIREEDPPQPSQRISTLNAQASSTISQRRNIDTRRLRHTVRGELDWIVMKALEKDRRNRYQSASALADDIGRYLRDELVEATRPTYVYRAGKVFRKNRTAISILSAVTLFMVVLIASFAWNRWTTELHAQATRQALVTAMRKADEQQAQRNVSGALDQLKHVETISQGGQAAPEEARQLAKRQRELSLLVEIEEVIGLQKSNKVLSADRFGNFTDVDQELTRQLREFGIDIVNGTSEQVAAQIQNLSVAVELSAVLDEWAICARDIKGQQDPQWQNLLSISKIADPDPLRNQLRVALEQNDAKTLLNFRFPKRIEMLPPGTAVILAKVLSSLGEVRPAIGILFQSQRLHPEDFWLNVALAYELSIYQDAPDGEAIRFYTVAVALRPQSLLARNGLAITFLAADRHHEAVQEFRKMLIVAGDDRYVVHYNLGNVYLDKRQYEGAAIQFRDAILIRPDFFQAYNNLGLALMGRGDLSDAEDAFRKGLGINPDDAMTRANLGQALLKLGNPAEAIPELQAAIRLDPDNIDAHLDLGAALFEKGQLAESLAIYQKTVMLAPEVPEAWNNLGVILARLGKFEEAAIAYEKSAKFEPLAETYFRLGHSLDQLKRFTSAIAAYNEAIRLGPRHVGAYTNLAVALIETGDWAEAIKIQQQVVILKPNDPVSHWSLAWYLTHARDPKLHDADRALEAASTALKLAPNDPHCHYNFAVAQYRSGQWQQCVNTLSKSLELDAEESCGACFFLAMASHQLKDQESASAWFKKGCDRLMMNPPTNAKFVQLRRDEASELLGKNAEQQPQLAPRHDAP